MKTQTTIRVDQDNYTQAKVILKYLGLSYSQAVNMFNSMIVFNKGLPFEIKIPNDETLQAMEEAKKCYLTGVSLSSMLHALRFYLTNPLNPFQFFLNSVIQPLIPCNKIEIPLFSSSQIRCVIN